MAEVSKVSWNDEYSIGIAEIDEQHKKLLDIINKMYDLLAQGEVAYKSNHKQIFKELMDYTDYHLKFEEGEFIDKYNYPSGDGHKSQHKTFVGSVKNRLENEDVVSLDSGKLLLEFLSSWLLNHIVKSDKGWAKHVLENQ